LPGQAGQERKRQTIVLERDRSEPVPVPASEISTPAVESKAALAEAPPDGDAPSPDEAAQTLAPAAAEGTPVVQRETASPQPAAAAPAPKSDSPAPETRSSTGMWAVQLGSFSNKANAERLAASLRSQGYAAFLSQLSSSGAQLHRVRIGPQKDRESAEAVARRLAAEGHKGQYVPHP
ncbi:MAG: SPOR domain-containing protein, partial [Halioglobus sp.]|nr:SPOR domain-containing protein [Halioglobus sp.]